MTTDPHIIGHIDAHDRAFCHTVDIDTGERGTGRFHLDTLCRLGYGRMPFSEIVVRVQWVTPGRVS